MSNDKNNAQQTPVEKVVADQAKKATDPKIKTAIEKKLEDVRANDVKK